MQHERKVAAYAISIHAPARGATKSIESVLPDSVISIHAPREGGDSKDAQFYLRIFDKQVELFRFLEKNTGWLPEKPGERPVFSQEKPCKPPGNLRSLGLRGGAGRRVPDTRAPYHCCAGRRASEDQGILWQIGALRTEMLHFFLILLPQIVKAQTVFLRIHDGEELRLQAAAFPNPQSATRGA